MSSCTTGCAVRAGYVQGLGRIPKGVLKQKPLLLVVQNRDIISVRYLPLIILAKTVLLQHSKLFPAELVQIW